MKKTDVEIIDMTKMWLSRFVIGLNLCPFAKHPFKNEKIRYIVHRGVDLEELTAILLEEMKLLVAETPSVIETTLIIIGDALPNFNEYLDYINMSNFILEEVDMDGIIQLASFHPQYQFEGTDIVDAENFTNRSPFPMLHLLREASIDRAIEEYPDIDNIPEKNIETMEKLGYSRVKEMLDDIIREN